MKQPSFPLDRLNHIVCDDLVLAPFLYHVTALPTLDSRWEARYRMSLCNVEIHRQHETLYLVILLHIYLMAGYTALEDQPFAILLFSQMVSG
jgi:hypothetical protein